MIFGQLDFFKEMIALANLVYHLDTSHSDVQRVIDIAYVVVRCWISYSYVDFVYLDEGRSDLL